MAQNKIDSRNFTEILFEGRNKKYGAYELRKGYYRNVAAGLIFAISLLVLGLLLPYLIDMLRPSAPLFEAERIVETELLPPPPGALELAYSPPVEQPEEEIVPEVTKDSVPEKKEPVKEKPKVVPDAVDTGSKVAGGGGGGTGPGSDEVFWEVDEKPVPPGGSWNNYISRNLRYPEQEKLMNVQGKVYISCIINKDGTLEDVKVVQGVSPGLNAEAIRVVKSMPPWQPGKRKGQPVRMIVKLPINFSLRR